MNLNKAFILGNLTRDPQVRNLPSGQLVANFGVATNRIWNDKNSGARQQQTEFHNVVVFGRLAETAQQYLKQGSMVLIEGRLQTRSWEGQDGVKRQRTEIIAENLQLGPKGQASSVSSAEGTSSKPKNGAKEEEIPTIEEDYNSPSTDKEEKEEIDVKDLPL
jgi:single-strand DNA-binding protein